MLCALGTGTVETAKHIYRLRFTGAVKTTWRSIGISAGKSIWWLMKLNHAIKRIYSILFWVNEQTNKQTRNQSARTKQLKRFFGTEIKKKYFVHTDFTLAPGAPKKIHSTVLIASRMNNVIWKYVIAINVVLLPLTLLSIHLQTVLEHTWWDRLDRQHFCKVLNIHYIKCLDMIE